MKSETVESDQMLLDMKKKQETSQVGGMRASQALWHFWKLHFSFQECGEFQSLLWEPRKAFSPPSTSSYIILTMAPTH